MKKILFAASEGVPFIKTGGLADVVGSLPKYIDKEYFDVRVFIPKYTCMKQEMKDKLRYVTHFYMDFNWQNDSACYDILFSVGGTDLDISDPFKYREDHGGLVSGIGRSAGIRNNDCKI